MLEENRCVSWDFFVMIQGAHKRFCAELEQAEATLRWWWQEPSWSHQVLPHLFQISEVLIALSPFSTQESGTHTRVKCSKSHRYR